MAALRKSAEVSWLCIECLSVAETFAANESLKVPGTKGEREKAAGSTHHLKHSPKHSRRVMTIREM